MPSSGKNPSAKTESLVRCRWCLSDPLYIKYHDLEWGVPVTKDNKLFEFLVLEGAQAGLSWLTVLKKRENYREAFASFVPEKVASFGAKQVKRLLQNPGIIRNRLKIESAIRNARAFLRVQEEFGSFAVYHWRFQEGLPLQNRFRDLKQIPARTSLSDTFSKDLKKRGFSFVGSTIIYAHMQATGMVNDHVVGCFRHRQIRELGFRHPK